MNEEDRRIDCLAQQREGLMEEFYQTTAYNRERKEELLALKDKEMRDYYRCEEDQWRGFEANDYKFSIPLRIERRSLEDRTKKYKERLSKGMAPLTQFLREEEKQRVDQDFDRQWQGRHYTLLNKEGAKEQ